MYLTHAPPVPVQWWFVVFVAVCTMFSAVARIQLGAHYPSDCVAGVLQVPPPRRARTPTSFGSAV